MKNFKLLFLILCLGLLSPAGMTSLYAQTCNNPLDIHVANDISGSVNSTEYLQSKDFVTQLGLSLPLGTSATESRIGISQWSSGSSRFVEYAFPAAGATYTTAPSDIIAYVNSARPFRGGTDPYTALLKAYEWVNQDPVGGRDGVPVIVLMTDASCGQIPGNLSALATQVKNQGITIVVMAIDNASGCTALQGENVASAGGYFSAADYNTLQANALTYITDLLSASCGPATPEPNLSVGITGFEITNCNTTPGVSLDYTVTNSGTADFNGTLDVSFYNGDPTLPGTQYLFTDSGSQNITGSGGTYSGNTTNAALLNAANVYAVVNIDGSLAANAVPLSPTLDTATLSDTTEVFAANNISSAFARTNATGCVPFADLNVQVTNSGIACGDQATYTVQVCNNGTGDAVMGESDITSYADLNFNLLNSSLVGDSPFVVNSSSGASSFVTNQLTNFLSGGTDYDANHLAADFDGDGDVDILSIDNSGLNNELLSLNNGSGVFTTTQLTNFLSGGSDYEANHLAADFDGDGDVDILSIDNSGLNNELLSLNNGSGVFTTTQLTNFLSGGTDYDANHLAADFDGDGDVDILSIDNSGLNNELLSLNNGSGVFTTTQLTNFLSGGSDYEANHLAADFDGDGDVDILSIDNSGLNNELLSLNNGSGVFTTNQLTNFLSGGTDYNANHLAADFDCDGDVDILSIDNSGLNNELLSLNNGSGVFTTTQLTNFLSGGSDYEANHLAADFDGDGDVDILSIDNSGLNNELLSLNNSCVFNSFLPANTCATYQYTYDVSTAGTGTFNYSVGLTATADTGDDPVQYSPNTNFTANGNPGLNGFDGAANGSDDLTRSGAAPACPSGDLITANMVLSPATCPGEFSTATLTITNQTGVELNNLELALELTGTDAVFNGEPYNLSTGLRLAQPNILDPAYPAVPNAISQTTGNQTLAIFNLPNGTNTVDIDIVLGTTQTDLGLTVQQIPTSYNASGDVSTTAGLTPGTVPTISGTPPADVTIAATTLTLNYSTTGANSVEWTSGSNGSFANAAAATTTYTINDLDRANGYVDLNLQAISADVCDASEGFRVNITGATFDYGDAPATYDFGETLLPTAAAATINPDIFLGDTPPGSENASTPTADATGDGIEEDGLNTAVIPDVKPGQTYTLTVTATNNDTTRPAYLRAFIDWNTDGDFLGDEGEVSQEVIVPANSGNSSYPVEFTVPANVSSNLSDVIVRLRLSTDEFAAARTFGASANGEVEDFQIQPNVCLPLNLKVYLAGALIDNGGATGSGSEPLMRDNLRSSAITGQIGNNVIPALEPYTALAGFTHVGSGGGRSATATAFDDRGQNSVVDWVFIEFRDKNDNTTVLETMSALVQRDGDVVDIDGVSPILLCTTEVEYFVAVRHRNHLGVMTALAEDLKVDNTVDFSDNNAGGSGVFNYGTSHPVGGPAGFDYTGLSQQSAFNFAPLPGGVNALWAGNSSGDDKIKFESPDDDLNTMLFSVLLFPGNSSFQPSFDFALTYDVGDLDMNGKVKFESPDDDQNFLLFQVLLHPLNNTFQSSFDFIFEQLP